MYTCKINLLWCCYCCFFLCVVLPSHVWEFSSSFFSMMFSRCFRRLMLHVRVWNDRYRYNIISNIKNSSTIANKKSSPTFMENHTHVWIFTSMCVFFHTPLYLVCVWFLQLHKKQIDSVFSHKCVLLSNHLEDQIT